ncbi:MAG: hypothetical protein HC854_02070 [Flavobacterium sp.]|nr:hypothetical protein [Flavobacterium sp.]
MKTKFLTVLGLFFVAIGSVYSNNPTESQVKVKDFNFSAEINYNGKIEELWNAELGLKMYVLEMNNSEDLLIAYQEKNSTELTPIAFYVNEANGITYKDINNRKDVLNLEVLDGKIVKYNYYEQNDSKSGFALKKCPGGSTINCIKFTMQVIASDGESAFYCALSGGYCPAAVATACAISCNL